MNARPLPAASPAHHGFLLRPPTRRRLGIDLHEAVVAFALLGFWCAAYCVACPADPAPRHVHVAAARP